MKKLIRVLFVLFAAALIFFAAAVMLSDFFPEAEPREYEYERGTNSDKGFDGLLLSSPESKNSSDLVSFVLYAWDNGWGYVWGTFGDVLDEAALSDLAERYPSVMENRIDLIRQNWLGRRCADCSGLIKAYLWYEPGIGVNYGAYSYPDEDANTMFNNARVSGDIESIPEISGLAVWCDGHIGIYIGDGIVVEAMGTEYGVVKTRLEGFTGSRWTHWFELEHIEYP